MSAATPKGALTKAQREALEKLREINDKGMTVTLPCAGFHYRGASSRLAALVRRGLANDSAIGYTITPAGRAASDAADATKDVTP